jgi:hypothetical protein
MVGLRSFLALQKKKNVDLESCYMQLFDFSIFMAVIVGSRFVEHLDNTLSLLPLSQS